MKGALSFGTGNQTYVSFPRSLFPAFPPEVLFYRLELAFYGTVTLQIVANGLLKTISFLEARRYMFFA